MKIKSIIIVSGFLMLFISMSTNKSYAQKEENKSKATVDNIKFKISNDRLTITYNIIGYKSVELFYPTVIITNQEPGMDHSSGCLSQDIQAGIFRHHLLNIQRSFE